MPVIPCHVQHVVDNIPRCIFLRGVPVASNELRLISTSNGLAFSRTRIVKPNIFPHPLLSTRRVHSRMRLAPVVSALLGKVFDVSSHSIILGKTPLMKSTTILLVFVRPTR